MRWTCDLTVGALYFELTSRPVRRQAEVADGLIVDYDDADRVVGIEVLGDNGRTAMLALAASLGLSDADMDLALAVIFSQVAGDRRSLGVPERPPTEGLDGYPTRSLELQKA